MAGLAVAAIADRVTAAETQSTDTVLHRYPAYRLTRNPAGMGSAVPEVAGLAVDTIAKMVTAAGPAAVRPHLPLLVGSLLESLSTLEVRSPSPALPVGSRV